MSEAKVISGPPQPQGVGEDPLTHFTRVFVRFLQVVFSTFPAGDYRWGPDMETTDVVISDQGVMGREVAEKKPLIACTRGGAQWLNVSMDQFKSFDFETGKRTHTDLVAAAILYNCISREGLEAQRLAWIAGYATRTLKRSLLRAGMHRVGENVDFSPEQDAENVVPDLKSYRLVQVSVPFFFQDTYGITPVDNLLLKDMDLRLTSEAVSQPVQQPALRPPAIGGRVLNSTKVFSLTQRVTPLGTTTQKHRK
jgi:hypothetical protein